MSEKKQRRSWTPAPNTPMRSRDQRLRGDSHVCTGCVLGSHEIAVIGASISGVTGCRPGSRASQTACGRRRPRSRGARLGAQSSRRSSRVAQSGVGRWLAIGTHDRMEIAGTLLIGTGSCSTSAVSGPVTGGRVR